jgi:beta-barrel assembly-enhancing protease
MKAVSRLIGPSFFFWITLCGAINVAGNTMISAGETRIWDLAVKAQMEQECTVTLLHDRELDAFVQQVAASLWTHVTTDLPPVRMRVVQESIAAAHAYPNGVIYLTTGMIAHARNPDQLAMIIAHEIIHYTQQHGLQAFNSLQDAASLNGADCGAYYFSSHGLVAKKRLAALHDLFEQQADNQGLELMHAAGYCIEEVLPLLRAFQNNQTSRTGSDQRAEVENIDRRITRMQVLIDRMADRCPGAGACRISPLSERAYQTFTASALLANARAAIQQGLWRLGAENVQRYLSIVPHDPLAHYLQGEIRSRNAQDPEQALCAYERAIGLDATFAPAYRAIGAIHFKAGRLARARDYFETSLLIAPHDPESEYIRGYIQLCRD